MNLPIREDAAAAMKQLAEWRKAVAQDLRELALLHSGELDAASARALVDAAYPNGLTISLTTDDAQAALELMRQVVAALAQASEAELDELAADFAAIYLNGAYHAPANESGWLDDDGLARQAPMFAVREWYRRHGVAAGDWRKRADDDLVLELQFVALLCDQEQSREALEGCARFMDRHLLCWLDDFARAVAQRCRTPFYAALVLLTAAYCNGLREVLAQLLDLPRPPQHAPVTAERGNADDATAPFTPGAAPSW